MNFDQVETLPLIALSKQSWYRSIEPDYAIHPPQVSNGATRFNPGNRDLGLLYFAPDPLVALFEARDLLGSFFQGFVPTFGLRHIVTEYKINLAKCVIVDVTEFSLPIVETTIQEMTGDWFTYPRGINHAPTQELAVEIYYRGDKPIGLIAPSARNPLMNNLILFQDRLPAGCVNLVDIF